MQLYIDMPLVFIVELEVYVKNISITHKSVNYVVSYYSAKPSSLLLHSQ